MPRITTTQSAHSYGVLDPHVVERRDTKFVGSSLSDGENIVLLPAGGYTDIGGTTDYGRARRKLYRHLPYGLFMPNGGSQADILAGVATTTNPLSGSDFVIFELSWTEARQIVMLDIGAVKIATTAADDTLSAQWWDGGAWQPFGTSVRVMLDERTRRFASGPPGHAGYSTTKVRVVASDASGAEGPITFSRAVAWEETGINSDGLVRRFAPGSGAPHQLVFTDGNVDVLEGGIWRAAIATPVTEAILRLIKIEPKFDTVALFHTDMRPQFIRRLGASDEWACDPIEFENVPLADYGGVYANGIDAQQDLALYEMAYGDFFDLALEGQTTNQIEFNSSTATTSANIKTALEALPNVGPGLTVAQTGADNNYRVTFSGDDNKERPWPTMIGTAFNLNGYVRTRSVTKGKKAGEPIFSAARGWPAVGRYLDQRLVVAGWPKQPNAFAASVTGSPTDFNTELEVSVSGFSYEIDNTENTRIVDITASRTLLFFGDKQVVYLKSVAGLNAEESPRFGFSDAPGIKASTSPINADNGVYYIQEGGSSLQLINYNAVEEGYRSDNASVLSAHLIRDPIDMARRRARGAVDSDLALSINADGSLTALTMMRSQEVSGFAPWRTAGQFRSLCVDHANDVWFLVHRLVDGVTQLRLELQEPDKLLDEAVETVLASPTATIAGLSRFNGRPVWIVANDSLFGPYNVTGGAVTLADEISGPIRTGTWRPLTATDPEISLEEESRGRHARLKRVNRAELSVIGATSLAIAVNGAPPVNIPLRANSDFITDTGPLARPYTGKIEADGMHGFTDHGKLTVTQLFPGHLTVRRVTKNIVT